MSIEFRQKKQEIIICLHAKEFAMELRKLKVKRRCCETVFLKRRVTGKIPKEMKLQLLKRSS